MKVEIETTCPGVPVPSYATAGSAGFDITNQRGDDIIMQPGEVQVITTGLKIKLPPGTAAFLLPRSGKTLSGYSVNNSPGLIDLDFRKEVRIIAINNGNDPITIEKGERIAQLMIVPFIRGDLEVVDQLSPDDFNDRIGGLGSTGKF